MHHYHIRWSGKLLNWEPFSTLAEADASARQTVLPGEAYTIEQYDYDTCLLCNGNVDRRVNQPAEQAIRGPQLVTAGKRKFRKN
jgi:hypothetical protein